MNRLCQSRHPATPQPTRTVKLHINEEQDGFEEMPAIGDNAPCRRRQHRRCRVPPPLPAVSHSLPYWVRSQLPSWSGILPFMHPALKLIAAVLEIEFFGWIYPDDITRHLYYR